MIRSSEQGCQDVTCSCAAFICRANQPVAAHLEACGCLYVVVRRDQPRNGASRLQESMGLAEERHLWAGPQGTVDHGRLQTRRNPCREYARPGRWSSSAESLFQIYVAWPVAPAGDLRPGVHRWT